MYLTVIVGDAYRMSHDPGGRNVALFKNVIEEILSTKDNCVLYLPNRVIYNTSFN